MTRTYPNLSPMAKAPRIVSMDTGSKEYIPSTPLALRLRAYYFRSNVAETTLTQITVKRTRAYVVERGRTVKIVGWWPGAAGGESSRVVAR